MKNIVILGTGGNCIDILDTVNVINIREKRPMYNCLGFLDDDEKKFNQEFFGKRVIGKLGDAYKFNDAFFINGIVNEKNFIYKEKIINKTGLNLDRFINVVHPSAVISDMAVLGLGNVFFQNVVITSSAMIGSHIIILPNTVVSHNTVIEDYSTITAGVCISGNVKIGKSCYLGTNCSIRQNLKIGNYSLIGMGSVVTKDIPECVIAYGCPAKYKKHNSLKRGCYEQIKK